MGISQQEYRQLMRSDESINFTCTRCNEEETLSGPAHSTHIEDSGNVNLEYGQFNMSNISAGGNTTDLNRTYTIEPAMPMPDAASDVDPTPPEPASDLEDVDPTPPEPASDLEDVDPTPPEPALNLTTTFDVSRGQEDNDEEIAEHSIQDPDLPDTILPDVPVIIIGLHMVYEHHYYQLEY
ncbi:uncharacterized protein LOC133200093 [Saccostrea echinata]|uniref:uncharacterized protein LOC133200093 n=1 Tax=Saccostrea echinata TaxID=191078 RepID=UPI002A81FE76|nr:uncharacterized protein LOC133200093 [Saccostrea echinata]